MSYLMGERVTLREYRMEDIPAIRKWANDHEITDTLSEVFSFPHTYENTESFVRSMVEGKTDTKGFIISEKDTLDYIGQIDLFKFDWRNRCATIGIVIGRKELLGQGYGREALRLIQEFAFKTLNLHRLELQVMDFNERGYRCYASCGFKEEGRQRQRIFYQGQYRDMITMSILSHEFN